MTHIYKKSSRNIGLECLIFFCFVLLIILCSAVQKSLEKITLLLLLVFILRLAGQISCLGGSTRVHSLFPGGFPVCLVLLWEPGDKHRRCHSTAHFPHPASLQQHMLCHSPTRRKQPQCGGVQPCAVDVAPLGFSEATAFSWRS